MQQFLQLWNDPSPTITIHTSGSTGAPKAIEVEKERMRASARMTCQHLGLGAGDTALLCMSTRYIAGMMMVVRAQTAGMKLISVPPSNHPLRGLTTAPTFAAMVSSQVYETLHDPIERQLFTGIRHIIIGGGALDTALEEELKTLPNHIWHSYGMTETLSHIALRQIGEPWFQPLPGISVSQDEHDCLVIDAPMLCPTTLHTHDIVEFCTEADRKNNASPRFRILGRIDNVICSGGIKIQIEEVEDALRPTFGSKIQITSAPHPKFGEELVLLTTEHIDIEKLKDCLPHPYWMPKRIVLVDNLPRTETGKPDRTKAKILAKKGDKR